MDRKILFRMVSSLFGFIAAAIVAFVYIFDAVKRTRPYGLDLKPTKSCDNSYSTLPSGLPLPAPTATPISSSDTPSSSSGTPTDLTPEFCLGQKDLEYNYNRFYRVVYPITTVIVSVIVAIIEIILLLPDSLKVSALLRPLLDCTIVRGFFYLYVGAMTFNVAGKLGSSAAVISCFVGLLVLSLDASSYA